MEVAQNQFNRKKPDQLVYLELGSGNGGMLLSISEDGFRFRAVSPLRPNGLMPFAFSFDGSQRLQGIGEVEWLEDDGKSGGMRFVEVSPDFRSTLEQWLGSDSARGKSSREVTPAAAAPLDTMEKIREELRRGYPQPPAKASAHEEPEESPPNASLSEDEPPAKQSPRSQPSTPVSETTEHPERYSGNNSAEQLAERTAAKKQERFDSHSRSPLRTGAHEQKSQPNTQRDRSSGDRGRPFEQRAKPFYPPPFTHPADESPSTAEKASSAFLKKPAPAAPSASASAPEGSTAPSTPRMSQSAAPAPAASRTREEAHASVETLRRPFRPGPRSAPSERPFIPPPADESFEAAWERAKLTAPPESPHLSRAAAGSIIGIALAVILGALAFNFRQEIGEVVIDLGQKISGNHAVAPPSSVPASENKDSQPAGGPSGPASVASDKPDTASSQTGSAPNTGGTNGPAGTRASDAQTQHDVSLGTVRDANPVVPRHTGSSGTTANTASSGNANAVSGGVSSSAGSSPVSAGNTAALIGTEPGGGQEEFNTARELLKGDHRHRDLSRAVDLLWAGVRKGYVPAEVTLADLYRRGDGVAKNCDQAQVLLVAASKKGSPEARQLLEKMAEEGCVE